MSKDIEEESSPRDEPPGRQSDWRRRFIKDVLRNADPRSLAPKAGTAADIYHPPLPMEYLIEAQKAPPWQPEPSAEVSIVLGTFERLPLLRKTLDSIRANGIPMAYEIIVVDGGSRDGTLEWLTKQTDILTIVQQNRSPENRERRRRSWGYFMNLGFRAAQGRWILMLSDDCLLVPNAVNAGVRYADQLKGGGRKVGGVAFYYRDWPEEQDYYVQSTLGGMMMVNHGLFSREALAQVGYAEEERYAFYKCDSDLALKLWASGYEIVDCPDAFVEHLLLREEQLRIGNSSTMARDRAELINRWKGVFVHPEFPQLFKRPMKHTLRFVDESRTAEAFKEFAQPKNQAPASLPPAAAAQGMPAAVPAAPKSLPKARTPDPVPQKGDITQTAALRRLSRLQLNPMQCISLGAGSGVDTMAVARALNPSMRVLMVEAQDTHRPALQKLASDDSSVDYVICAAGSHDGSITFSASSPTGGAIVSGEAGGVTVPSRAIDSLVRLQKLEGPYFLKFDTHGAELQILEGAARTLAQTALIMMEIYNFKLDFAGGKNLTFDEMGLHLKSLGFRMVDLCLPLHRPGDGVFWQAHFFYVRSDHPVFWSNSYKAPDIAQLLAQAPARA